MSKMPSSTEQFVVGNAVCYLKDTRGSCQLSAKGQQDRTEVYLNCSIVSLRSARVHNPGIAAALVVNFDIPQRKREEIERLGISIHQIDFSVFRMPDSFLWAPAYFKLEALAFLIERYEHVTLIDCDTFTVGSYAELQQESEDRILLYDPQHRLLHPDRQRIIQNHAAIFGESALLMHYGGEFVAGPRDFLKPFMEECEGVACAIRERSHLLVHDMGDEQILSVAAHRMPNYVRCANSYIFRYWTAPHFRLLSTNYEYDGVDIWHLPSEKERGLDAMYRYLRRYGEFPNRKTCIRIFGLDRPNAGRISEKLRHIRNHYLYR